MKGLTRTWTNLVRINAARKNALALCALLVWVGAGPALAQTAEELIRIVRAKAEIAKELIERRVREGHDVDDLVARATEIANLGEAGKLRRVNDLLDQLLVAAYERSGNKGRASAFKRFAKPQPVVIRGLPLGSGDTPISTEEPFVSRDGRFLFFNSAQQENNKDLHYAEFHQGGWVYRDEIGPDINNAKEVQGNPTMDRYGNFFFIDSATKTMIRAGRFRPESGRIEDVREVRGVPPKDVRLLAQKLHGNMGVEITADGDIAFFSRATWKLKGISLGGIIGSELLFARKLGEEFLYDEREARRVLATINTQDLEYAASISADGLELFFTRLSVESIASGNVRSSIMRATRASDTEAFGEPTIIESIGTSDFVEGPAIAPDGRTLYYHKRKGDKFRLYKVSR
jgi:hypothetical protein